MNEKPDAMPQGYGELTFGSPRSLVIDSMEKAWRLATLVVRAKMAPSGMDTVEAVCIAILHGAEIGLPPLMAIQRIAVIGGRPTVWGDAALSIVMNSGLLEEIDETVEGQGDQRIAYCTVKRKGFKARIASFSVEDAKIAGLWDDRPVVRRKNRQTGEWFEVKNDSPWRRHPNRMLQMRARGFGLRDNFSDVLGGLYLREEFTGMTIEHDPSPITPRPNLPHNDGPPTPPPEDDGPPAPPEEQSVGDNTMPPPEYRDDGPPAPPSATERLSDTEIDLLLSAYKERIASCLSEEKLDTLWEEVVYPYIDADRLNDTTLEQLQALDDAQRGILQNGSAA